MRMSMMKREPIITISCILFIFIVGFLIRLDYVYLPGTPNDEKPFFEGSDGLPYMFDLDSYYNYRITKNFIEHGYLGDTKINGTEWDMHSYYPPGVPMDYPPLIAYLSAFIYYLINLLASIPLLTVVFWISALVAPLSGVIAYFLVRRFTNDLGAVAAGIFIVTSPMFVVRTMAGWFDTDMFNIFFPLLVTLLFFMAIDNRDNFRKGLVFAVLAAFSMFLYSLAWNGWQYMFYFIMVFSAIYLIWCKYRGRNIKNFIFVYLIFVLSSLLLVGILSGFINVYKLFMGPLELIEISQNPWAPWPDVYSTVVELGKPSFLEIINSVGLTFFAGLFGFIFMFRVMTNDKLKNSILYKMNWFYFSFLLLWAVVGFFTLIKGARFIMMLIPPICVSSGIFIGIVMEYLNNLTGDQRFDFFKQRKYLVNIIAITLILMLIIIPTVLKVHSTFVNLQPRANDDMWGASEWIHNYTSNDTVIISQWSDGHFFSAISDRPVVFDGRMGYIETLPSRSYGNAYPFGDRSPGTYREYWMAKAFSTSNETLSSGIFRMLASSGDLAYLSLNGYTKDTAKSVEILNNILGLDREAANEVLIKNYSLSQDQADEVLRYTHPDNTTPYVLVITDQNLVGDGPFKYGEWDFNKNNASDVNYSYRKFKMSNGILNTTDGLKMNLNSGTITWNNKTPYKLITITDNLTTQRTIDNNSDFIVILLMNDEKAIVMDKNFENSLLTKLITEQSSTTDFEIAYKTTTVFIWKYKK